MNSPQTKLPPSEIAALQRRTLRVVVASQIFGGTGLAAGVTVGGLLAKEMVGGNSVAGLPSALFTLGSALTAFVVGQLTQRHGRRLALSLGFGVGALGATLVVVAAATSSIWLLFPSLFLYGAGTATNLQARYGGTDLAPPHRKATAVSIAMVSTTLGAVAGPNLVDPLGSFAQRFNIEPLAGPFMLAAVAYSLAGLVLVTMLRPDPFLVAMAQAAPVATRSDAPTEVDKPNGLAYLGAAVMVMTQVTMVAIMTMTPVHMREHGHGVGQVGLVIGFHIGAMYLPSLVTGSLVDRIGRIPMALGASGVMVLAALSATWASPHSVGAIALALILLGLGWNMGLISGTALVIDGTSQAQRPRFQGTSDVAIALAGAGGGAMSGVVMATSSYGTLSLVGGAVSLGIIPALWWFNRRRETNPAAGD